MIILFMAMCYVYHVHVCINVMLFLYSYVWSRSYLHVQSVFSIMNQIENNILLVLLGMHVLSHAESI